MNKLIQKTLDVLSLYRPIVHDTAKTAKIDASPKCQCAAA